MTLFKYCANVRHKKFQRVQSYEPVFIPTNVKERLRNVHELRYNKFSYVKSKKLSFNGIQTNANEKLFAHLKQTWSRSFYQLTKWMRVCVGISYDWVLFWVFLSDYRQLAPQVDVFYFRALSVFFTVKWKTVKRRKKKKKRRNIFSIC